MRIQLVDRGYDLSDQERSRAHELLGKLEKVNPKVTTAEVVFTPLNGHACDINARISVSGRSPVVVNEQAGDALAAIDIVYDRARRVLRKRREKRRDLRRKAEEIVPLVMPEIDEDSAYGVA